MLLAPFFLEKINPNWLTLGIFLSSGGRDVWSVDGSDKEILEILRENGFPVLGVEKQSDILYVNIDRPKLELDTFYIWDEIDPDKSQEDLWRTFNIPLALWSCEIFKEQFFSCANLPTPLSKPALISALIDRLSAS
jgi:hypothetical protein